MKFKDLSSIVSGHYQQEQIELMTQEELEIEILRLFKEEKKYSKDKATLYNKVYKALEVIDLMKKDFVANAGKDLRQLYFKSFAYNEPLQAKQTVETVKKNSPNLYHQAKDTIKSAHFTQPRFTSLDEINNFLKDILNNQMVTVIDGKYLQVYSKAQYKIS